MIEPAYHYCPRCGGSLVIVTSEGQERQQCSVCHETVYINQNAAVCSVIVRDNTMLLVRRSRDPHKGMLDIPGGFVEPNESTARAVIREVKEELGVDGTIEKLFGIYGPNAYPYHGMTYYNCDCIYKISIGDQTPIADDDAASIEWIPLDQLPFGELPFPSQNAFLEDIRSGRVTL